MRLTSRFSDALVYAASLHAYQKRKGGDVPYISHLLCVSGIALAHGADEDEAIAALLHDAIEDQGGAATGEAIRRQFGERVFGIVQECSDSMARDPAEKAPWHERKEAYLAHLRDASVSARLISAADTLHNASTLLADYRSMGEAVWARFNGGKQGTLWYYRSVVEILKQGGRTPLFEQLDRVVGELEVLATARPDN